MAHAYDEATVQAWLDNASGYGVVSIQDNKWRFDHDKLRETLIADIPDDVLSQIHRTAAETIETVYPDDAGYNEALLAHWQATGDLDKTYQYLLPVTKYMIEISGTYTIAEAHLHQMLGRLSKDDGRCVLWNRLADSFYRQSNYSASQDYASQAQELATSLDDREGLANSLNNLADALIYQGEYARATDLYQQSMVISQQLGDQAGIAQALTNLGVISIYSRYYKRADDLMQQSLAIYQQLNNKYSLSYCLNNLGLVAFYIGAFERAKDLLEQSLTISQQLDDKFNSALTMSHIGWLLLQQRLPDARVKFYDSLLLSTAVGSPPLQAFNIVGLAGVLHQADTSLRSTELLGMVQVHPSTERMIRQRRHEYLLSSLIFLEYPEDKRLIRLTCSTSNPGRSGGGTSHYRVARTDIHLLCSEIDQQVADYLLQIQVDPEFIPLIRECYTTEIAEKLGHNRLNERARIEAALKATDEEEARAARLFAAGKITEAVWDSLWAEWQDRRRTLRHSFESADRQTEKQKPA